MTGAMWGGMAVAFVPHNQLNAISEVVFVVNFGRPFSHADISNVKLASSQWKEELPRTEEPQVLQFVIGSGPVPTQAPVPVVSFQEIARDGTLAWRLHFEGNIIIVNCLKYTRWSEVWPRALRHLSQASEVIMKANNAITNIALQYVDAFYWDGREEEYRISSLIDKSSPYIPPLLWENEQSPMWHCHTGWFRRFETPYASGNLLDRIHMDAVMENGRYAVKIDNTLRLDPFQPYRLHDRQFGSGENARVDRIMKVLHDENKVVLSSILTADMKSRVGLT